VEKRVNRSLCKMFLKSALQLQQGWSLPCLTNSVTLDGAFGIFSGGFSGCVAKTCVAPLSRIVIQMQLHALHGHGSIRDVISGIYAEGGFSAFWRGNTATLWHRGLSNCINFPVNSWCKERLHEHPEHVRNILSAFGGSLAGICIGHPIDVVRTRLCAAKRFGYTGIRQTASRIYVEEGFSAFYAGFRISLCTVVPNVACCFYLKDVCMGLPMVSAISSSSSGWINESAVAGGLGGGMTAFLFYPCDSLKRQQQMGISWVEIWKKFEGWSLYRGLAPELFKVSCNTAIMFGLYEWLRPTVIGKNP